MNPSNSRFGWLLMGLAYGAVIPMATRTYCSVVLAGGNLKLYRIREDVFLLVVVVSATVGVGLGVLLEYSFKHIGMPRQWWMWLILGLLVFAWWDLASTAQFYIE